MSTELTPMQTFQEKVKSKLKDSIADMLPDEALQALVQQAVKEQFFEPVRNGNGYITGPGWFVQAVANECKPIIEAVVREHVETHREKVTETVKKFLTDHNLMLLAFAELKTQQASEISKAVFDALNARPRY